MLGFPEHRNVPTCPNQTLAVLEFLSESWNFHQKFIHQDGVGQTGGCWDGPSSFPHIPPEVLGILRLGPRSPTERSGRGKCQPPELGRGGQRSTSVFPVSPLGNNLLRIHLSVSGL